MKLMIWIGILVGGTVGGFIGGMLDHGNLLGTWSIILSTVGSLVGVLAGYKIGKAYF
jgi:membrane protein DedA with SNARE-associated domain